MNVFLYSFLSDFCFALRIKWSDQEWPTTRRWPSYVKWSSWVAEQKQTHSVVVCLRCGISYTLSWETITTNMSLYETLSLSQTAEHYFIQLLCSLFSKNSFGYKPKLWLIQTNYAKIYSFNLNKWESVDRRNKRLTEC